MVKFESEIRTKENETAPKVEKWEWNALKNALDDSARVFLTSQDGFKEDHWLMNGRLIISTIAVLFSAYALYDDWIHPFPLSRSTLIACVVAYFLTILLLTWYTNYVERGCFAVAHCKDSSGRRIYWRMYSKQVQRPNKEDIYALEIELADDNKRVSEMQRFEKSVAKYFDEEGTLCTKMFYNDLNKFFSSFRNTERANDKKTK